MSRSQRTCVFLLSLTLAAHPQGVDKTKSVLRQKQPVKAEVQPPVAEAPAAPVTPPRPAQRPPVPARVSMSNGMVTVIAENSTLTDVLNGIQKVTGIKIDSGGIVSHERVAAQIGPAPVREILYSLLQGSRYDFIILSALSDPAAVERVILTPRVAGASQPAGGAQKPAQPRQEIEPVEVMDNDEGSEGFAPPTVTAPSPAPGSPSPAQVSPGVPPPGAQIPAETRTPEQIQDEIRNNQRDPNGVTPYREPRPERPK